MNSLPAFLRPLQETLGQSAETTVAVQPPVAPAPQQNSFADFLKAEAAKAGLVSAPAPATATEKQAQEKCRFMLVGTHAHQFTGYSKVTYNIIRDTLCWFLCT